MRHPPNSTETAYRHQHLGSAAASAANHGRISGIGSVLKNFWRSFFADQIFFNSAPAILYFCRLIVATNFTTNNDAFASSQYNNLLL